MIGIYKITSPKGKIYIGQSVDIEKRFRKYHSLGCKGQTKLYNSFLKHGVENHIFETLEECSLEQLTNREGYYQDLLKVTEEGLNCRRVTTSDASGYFSKESRKKVSEGRKGIIISKEHKDKLKIAFSGENNPMFGLKGNLHPAFGYKFSKEAAIKRAERLLGQNNHNSKLILDTQTGIFYDTLTEASLAYNINKNTLGSYLRGEIKNKTSLNYA